VAAIEASPTLKGSHAMKRALARVGHELSDVCDSVALAGMVRFAPLISTLLVRPHATCWIFRTTVGMVMGSRHLTIDVTTGGQSRLLRVQCARWRLDSIMNIGQLILWAILVAGLTVHSYIEGSIRFGRPFAQRYIWCMLIQCVLCLPLVYMMLVLKPAFGLYVIVACLAAGIGIGLYLTNRISEAKRNQSK
jgi:hypothetical protein